MASHYNGMQLLTSNIELLRIMKEKLDFIMSHQNHNDSNLPAILDTRRILEEFVSSAANMEYPTAIPPGDLAPIGRKLLQSNWVGICANLGFFLGSLFSFARGRYSWVRYVGILLHASSVYNTGKMAKHLREYEWVESRVGDYYFLERLHLTTFLTMTCVELLFVSTELIFVYNAWLH